MPTEDQNSKNNKPLNKGILQKEFKSNSQISKRDDGIRLS